MRALPRSQIRSDSNEGLLLVARNFCELCGTFRRTGNMQGRRAVLCGLLQAADGSGEGERKNRNTVQGSAPEQKPGSSEKAATGGTTESNPDCETGIDASGCSAARNDCRGCAQAERFAGLCSRRGGK